MGKSCGDERPVTWTGVMVRKSIVGNLHAGALDVMAVCLPRVASAKGPARATKVFRDAHLAQSGEREIQDP